MCSLLALLLSTGTQSSLLAAPITEVVVKTGDKGPDNDGTFDLSSSGDTVAALNNCGWAAFEGSLSNTTIGRYSGEFLADGTTRIQVARRLDHAPGGASTDAFQYFYNLPALNDSSQLSFIAQVVVNNHSSNCLFRSNPLTRLVNWQNVTAPGGNGSVTLANLEKQPTVLNNKGLSGFVATLTGTGRTNDDSAIYRTNATGGLTEIVREGHAVPEGNGVFDQILTGASFHPILNETGQLAFRAKLIGANVNNSNNQGIYRGAGGTTLTKIARSGDTLPGGGTIHSFSSVGGPDMNDSGEVVFPVDLDGDTTTEAIYKGSGGALTKIAREGDPIPNSPDTFAAFNYYARINNKGQVAFNAAVLHTNPTSTYWAIFRGDGTAANNKLVVKEGQAVPVGRGGTFRGLSINGTLNDNLSGFCLNSSGQVAFRAGIDTNGDTTVDEYGIYLFDGSQLLQVARTNDTFVWPDNKSGTITALQFAGTTAATIGNGVAPTERSGLNDAGQVAFGITTRLADNTSRYGIAIWSPTLKLLCAYSRKTQGTKTFDFELPLIGTLGVECRSSSFASGGTQDNFTLLLRFTNKLSSVGSASVTTGVGSVSGTPTINANTMTVNLTGVTNAQKIIVTLNNVRDAYGRTLASATVPMGILFGDIDGNRTVDSKDVNAIKVGAAISQTTFRQDVNIDGSITQQDANATQNHVGTHF